MSVIDSVTPVISNDRRSGITPYTFDGQDVRTAIDTQGNPMFCLPEVCRILDIDQPSKVKNRLDEKGMTSIPTPTAGGLQELTYISEPNLYRVIFQSRKPDAVRFQNWIFEVVIPSIRKTGSYMAKPMSTLDILELNIKQLREMETRQNALESKVNEVNARLSEHQEDYFALRGWYILQGLHIDEASARKVGKALTKYCKAHEIKIASVADPKYGRLNMYHRSVLERIDEILEASA